MSDISICTTSFNLIQGRGEEVVKRSIDSINKAIEFYEKAFPDKVFVSIVDDGSTDDTVKFLKDYTKDDKHYIINELAYNRYIGFARNLAASAVKSELLCLFDLDDTMDEDHLVVCRQIIESVDGEGRKVAIGHTQVKVEGAEVHADWLPRLAYTIPITKIIRREAWEFVEGVMDLDIHRKTGCDDQWLMQKLNFFFMPVASNKATVTYYNYPGSFFDRQLPKFKKPPGEYNPSTDDPKDLVDFHNARLMMEQTELEYLKRKLAITDWAKRLKHLVTNFMVA